MSHILQAGDTIARVSSCNLESHTERRYGAGVWANGGSSGVASSGVFKSTDSWRRSSINYHFRLFKLREDKKVGGIGGMQKRERERAEPPTLLLIFFLSAFSTQIQKGKKKNIYLSFAVVCHL